MVVRPNDDDGAGVMEVDNNNARNPSLFEDGLFSNDQEKCYEAALKVKSMLIGSNRRKNLVIERGCLVPRLISLLQEELSSCELRLVVVQCLGSLAKGLPAHLETIVGNGAVQALLRCLGGDEEARLVESSLSSLRAIFCHHGPPASGLVELLYSDPSVVPHLLGLMHGSTSNKIAVANILTAACRSREHQDALADNGVVQAVCQLLTSPYYEVQLPALQLLASLMCDGGRNLKTASMVPNTTAADTSCLIRRPAASGDHRRDHHYRDDDDNDDEDGVDRVSLMDQVVAAFDRQNGPEMQLAAAQCISYLYRSGVLDESDDRVVYKTLPTLVRLTKDHGPAILKAAGVSGAAPVDGAQHRQCGLPGNQGLLDVRIAAAETLALLIELSPELQRIAFISNHVISTMESFLNYEPPAPPASHLAANAAASSSSLFLPSSACLSTSTTTTSSCSGSKMSLLNSGGLLNRGQPFVVKFSAALSEYREASGGNRRSQVDELKRVAFRVFAALAANDEDIRKKVIGTKNLMEHLVASLEPRSPHPLQMAAVGCLHSMSRSVKLLRTTFQDYPVWKQLMGILSGNSSSAAASVDFLVIASSTLCNLLLDFSPSKEPILESGAVDLLCSLTHKLEPALVLNGVWGLMNMAFLSSLKVKVQIVTTLGSDQIFRLLADPDINIVMKTLGLLRNLLSSTKEDIDHVMSMYGKQVMQAVVFILEGDKAAEVKEQALCILTNIADGDTSKAFIMANEDVLKKIANYMMHHNAKLQMAAVLCIHNLIRQEDKKDGPEQQPLQQLQPQQQPQPQTHQPVQQQQLQQQQQPLVQQPSGASERRERLREIGILGILQHMSPRMDP